MVSNGVSSSPFQTRIVLVLVIGYCSGKKACVYTNSKRFWHVPKVFYDFSVSDRLGCFEDSNVFMLVPCLLRASLMCCALCMESYLYDARRRLQDCMIPLILHDTGV